MSMTHQGLSNYQKSAEFKIPDSEYDEITIDVVGNVDSGKSSLCGILSDARIRENISNIKEVLDDGNGSARSRIVSLKHEKVSGKTSSIGYYYMGFDSHKPKPRIISLVDLCGHENYLKTTISGVTGSYPNHGLVLIAKNITHMTREHYCILTTMGIPVLFVLTKMDITPQRIVSDNIEKIRIMGKRFGKELIEIRTPQDIEICSEKINGFIRISNKTGEGIPLLIEYISNIKNKPRKLLNGFSVDSVYPNVTGFGIVVAGMNGTQINKGDSMYITINNEFIPIKIRSIHNDYRHFVDVLQPGIRGCLCIRFDSKNKPGFIRKGSMITHEPCNVQLIKKFTAQVAIFRGKSSNIKVGYNSYINIGLVRGSIRFNSIKDKESGLDIEILNTGRHAIVEIEFIHHLNCISIDDKFLFRNQRTCGIGKVISFI